MTDATLAESAAPAANIKVDGDRLWDSLMEMAKIGPGIAGGNNRQALTDEDAEEVRALVEEHLRRTSSPVAQRVLDSWHELLPRFVKVFPTDYKRVLAEQAAAAEQELAA